MNNWFNAMMTVSLVSFWIILTGKCQGGIILTVISQSYTPSVCILDAENMATVSCEITPAISTIVVWKRNGVSQTICDNTADACLPDAVGRYNFSSNVAQRLFYFNIVSVTLGTDEGIYQCAEGGFDESIALAVCKVPTTVTFTESGNGITTLTSSSDCVYPQTDVTIEWFYVTVIPQNTEKRLDLTPTNGSTISDCLNGAKKVTSTIKLTDVIENKIEVYFRVRISHPASAEPVVATFYNKSYFIEDNNSEDSGNKGLLIGVLVTASFLVAGVITLFGLYIYFKAALHIFPLYEGNRYILKWTPPLKTAGLESYPIYTKFNDDDWDLISEEKTTISEINTLAYDFKVCAKYRIAIQSTNTENELEEYAELEKEIGRKMNVKDELLITPISEGDGFKLTWQAPEKNSEVFSYQVLRRTDDDDWIVFHEPSSDSTYCVIDNLAYDWKVCKIFRQEVLSSKNISDSDRSLHLEIKRTQIQGFRFQVMRQNDKGNWEHFSFADLNNLSRIVDKLDCVWKVYAHFKETLGEKKKVKGVCIIPCGDNSDYTLTWTLPHGLSVRSYHILRRRYHEKWEKVYSVPKSKTSSNFHGNEYQWKVCAEEGNGRTTDIGVAKVDNGVPGKPKNLGLKLEKYHGQQGEKTKLSMTWKTPVYSGESPVQYYQIWLNKDLNAHEIGNNWERFKVALPQQTSFIDYDWRVGVDFQIGICAVNKQGYGRMVSKIFKDASKKEEETVI